MQICDFTQFEIDYYLQYCNFTDDEKEMFLYRSKNIKLDVVSEVMNVSRRTADRLCAKIRCKIIKTPFKIKNL